MIAAAAIFGLTYGLAAPLIALDLRRRGFGETAIGLNAALYGLGALVTAVALPALCRRFGVRAPMAAGLAAVALALPGFPLAPWLWLWFPLRFLLGMASEAVFVTSEAWVNAQSSESSRARQIAIYTAALSTGFALGPSIVSAMGSHDARSYAVGAGLALVALLVALNPRAAAPRVVEEAASPGSRLAAMRLVPVALAATALNAALETSGLSFLPIYAMRLGWSESGATLLTSTLMVGAIALQLPIGWLGDRYDRRALLILFAALSSAGALLWPFVFAHAGLAHALVFVWGGVFVGIYTLAMTIVGSRFAGGDLTTVYATLSLAWGIGALCGPALTGIFMELGRHGLPLFAAAACGSFALFAALRRDRSL